MGEQRLPPRPAKQDRDTPTQLAAPPSELQASGQLIAGKYELKHMIAQGGMGAVWKAIDTQLERPVAIKFMSPVIAHDAHARQRFNREAKATARLHTPHVVRIFEHGLHESSPFIVMELLEGRDLHSRLKRDRRIGIEETARIIAQVAKGLRAAHEAQIIHRDLKPQNIFLANVDGELVVKILDFGVAKMEDNSSEATKTGIILGSPHYMSPEQARGKADIDHRSDVWSLAVITFRMVTGKMAFTGEGQGDVIIAIATSDIPVPSQVNPDLLAPIDAFFARALERDRDQRFASAIELATAFAAAVRACSDASLLTPSMGHPLRPPENDEHPMEATQVIADAQPMSPPAQRVPFASNPGAALPVPPVVAAQPSHPGFPPAALQTPHSPSFQTPAPQSSRTPHQGTPYPTGSGTPYPNSQSLHTPATGPSIAGLGNAIFSAPPAPRPQRKLFGIIAVVTVALACLGIFAAASGGPEGEKASTEPSSSPSAAEPAATPEPADAPFVEPTPAPSMVESAAPEPSATASAAASTTPDPPPTIKPSDGKSFPKTKPKNPWDDLGY
jgi:serine/threonine-protein kinase